MTGRPRAILLVILLAGILPGMAAAAPPVRQATVESRVWQRIQAEGSADVLLIFRAQADLSGAEALSTKEAKGRYVYETLQAVAAAGQQSLRATLQRQRVSFRSFYIVNAVELQADSAMVRSLAARPEVGRIVLNPRVAMAEEQQAAGSRQVPGLGGPSLDGAGPSIAGLAAGVEAGIEPNLIRVNADDVWALGYTGQGIVVAGQDTGYDWDHPALKAQYRGWNGATADHDYNWHDAIHAGGGICGANSPGPCDDEGHGTHTMGTIVGDDGANRVGMAPGAQWIGCRNMDEGVGTPATYIECFQFFLAPYPVNGTPDQGDPALAPDVVNNSWSCPPDEGCDREALELPVEALRQAGIVVVVSAGNEGSSCASVANPPAIYQQSFSVGAFYSDINSDEIASFSSRGPVTYGGETYTKPDIAAPGVGIRSSVPGGGYGYSQGTSMAAPHVAGAVALLLSAAPDFIGRVDAIQQILQESAEPKTALQGCGGDSPSDVPNNVWGWGILDSLAAVEAATGSLTGTVIDRAKEIPVRGARVTAVGVLGPLSTTDVLGSYALTLASGSYSVTAQASGYFSQTISGVSVISGQLTTADFSLEPKPLKDIYLPLCLSSHGGAAP